jgi:hypothetical protein
MTPVQTKRAKPTQNVTPKKRAPEKRPREATNVAMAVRELMRLDEEGSEDDEAARVLDRLEAQRHQLMWTGPDGVAFPAHPATTPEMRWAVGQAILEAILVQAVLARNGPDGVVECCEALAEARGKGKVILSSLIKKIKAQKPDYTSKKWEGKFEKKKENSSDKKSTSKNGRGAADQSRKSFCPLSVSIWLDMCIVFGGVLRRGGCAQQTKKRLGAPHATQPLRSRGARTTGLADQPPRR